MNLILSVVTLIFSIALTKLFCVFAQDTRLMDKPNERSMHSKPTIRGGGLVFIGLSLASLPLLCFLTHTPFIEQAVFTVSLFMIAAVSFLDDLCNLSVKPRFLVQCLVALLVAAFIRPQELDFIIFSISYPALIIPFIFVLTLWAINHFNFMDGLDGFCASQAVFIFAAYALLFGMYGASFYQSFSLVLVFSVLGFLVFNLPPAKLFMGDIGSATLGFITFSLALIAQQKFQIPIVYWFMLNGLFLFDASCTLIRRMLRKEKWSAPHRKHAYQRLRQSGISVPVILSGQTAINFIFLMMIFLVQKVNMFGSNVIILLQIGLISLIYYVIENKFPMFHTDITS